MDAQNKDKHSTLHLYRHVIALRTQYSLGTGTLQWFNSPRSDVLIARNGTLCVCINFGYTPIDRPAGKVVAQSRPGIDKGNTLPGNSAVWIALNQIPHTPT